jgi:general secretion pathway protein N
MNTTVANPSATNAYRFPWLWVVLGVATYLVVLLATLPAARLTTRLQASGIVAAGVSGSIWNGRAAVVQANGISLGATEWQINPWRLLTATLSVDMHCKRDDGYIDATVRQGFIGAVTLRNVRGSLPLTALSGLGLPGGGTSGWGGSVQLKLDQLTLVNRWPTDIKGTIEAVNLVGPAQQPTSLGGYRITFPAPSGSAAPGELQGAVMSLDDAPLDVVGTVRLTANRNYVIDAQVATRPTAPASIVKALQYLGPPDAQGKRPLSIAGSL